MPISPACARFLAGTLIALAGTTATEAGDPPSTVVVVDGSGSMWGAIPGDKQAKLYIVGDALKQALAKAPPQSRIGLASFGHRRKGDCSDAEVIVAPAPESAGLVLAAIDKLNPRGKGPLAQALRATAKAIGPGKPGHIVLLHDGPDNCGQDPCAAATEIAKSNPDLAVHVIGIGLDPKDARAMSCVAKTTRGRMLEANDAAGLRSAVAEVTSLALLDQGSPAISRAPETAAPDGAAGPSSAGPAQLQLSATLGRTVVTAPVRWRVAAASASSTVEERTGARLTLPLEPGTYEVQGRIGAATATATVEIAADRPTEHVMAFDAGGVLLTPAPGVAAAGGMLITISPEGAREGGGVPDPVWIGDVSAGEVILPSGSYTLRAEAGRAVSRSTITVAAGSRATSTVTAGVGRLQIEATRTGSVETLDGVTFLVFEDDPDSPSGRREIARSSAPRPVFLLPPGTYYVAARLGQAETQERIAISAGDTIARALTLDFASVRLGASLAADGSDGDLPVIFTVLTAGDSPVEVARSAKSNPEFSLPAGRYRFEAQLLPQNVKASAEADLEPGGTAEIALRLEAGHITVKSAGDSAEPNRGLWEIRDESGRVVWHSSATGSNDALLAPGRYVVRSEAGGRRSDVAVEIAAGERRTVEIGGR